MNILVVEPSKSYSSIISSLLNEQNNVAKVAHSGSVALDYLSENSPDAICVAYELGDMNSFEFIETMKQNLLGRNIPKFLISSESSDNFKKKCYEVGYTEIFVKSEISVLYKALNSIMKYTTVHISARILYVEDIPSTAAYTKSIMSSVGWEVTHVFTGEDALRILESNDEFDLVITDLILPGKISGINLINEIREQDNLRTCPLPVMALSGWNDLLRQIFVLQHGASDFISKPFQEADFLARSLILIQNKKLLENSVAEKNLLNDIAYTDKLTGLLNRHGFDKFSHEMIKKNIEQHQSLSVMMLDLDHFKQINDQYGHASGDTVLKEVGFLIKSNCRENDMAVRFGGEEFVCLFPKCDKYDALNKAECLRKKVQSLTPIGIPITTSIGVTCLNQDNTAPLDTVIDTADQALYMAKNSGRNQVHAIDFSVNTSQ